MSSFIRPRLSRPSPALVVAVMALVAALAGTAVAEQATTAVSKKKTKKIANKQANKQIDKRLPFESDDIADGAITNQKLSSPTYTAFVDAAGNLVRGNATSAQRVNNGNYRVEFDVDISQCTYQATPTTVNRTAIADVVNNNAQQAFIRTALNTNNTFTDSAFSLAVFC